MNILVCVKQVIDTGAAIEIQNGKVQTDGLPRVLNPYDEFAVEEAVRIKEADGESTVTLISMGPENFKDTLRKGLAMGADKAVHLLDPAFEGLDSLGVAQVLAAGIRTLDHDLILCGRQAVDDDMAQVGPSLAVLLGLPFVSVITRLNIADDRKSAEVTRQIEGGSEIIETPLPAVLTCQKGLNEPRLPSLKGIMAAKKKEIAVLDAAAIGFDPATQGSAANHITQVDLAKPPARKKGVMLEGSPQEISTRLLGILRDEIKVV
ncbi:electron transfer flavoprotein subunit beta/FixA family protein [Nitrospina gracilis]|uniref:electron transfer flavoprotein subunit beta/FixA family protein n=1 Tax=Nitrospina gracilis TaxID=35801 RepID=UPI001F3B978B|nr:electron transfer flavoprotein beta subunit [Nitrospina gracilis Nb-211]